MGRRGRKQGRDVHGILLLDKPQGITSNDVLQKVKRLYQARKAGHTGSLDKTATGLLPLCFGDATKFSAFLLDADKHYRASCVLGSETSTGDEAGEIVETHAIPQLSETQVEKILDGFRGEIEQVPPMFSALKVNGQRLYKLAYQGKEVERAARPVTISRLSLETLDQDSFDIEVVCSKGTYIRSLVQDIGRQLGCGAHVSALRRLGSGPFSAENMVDFESLKVLAESGLDCLDEQLLPVDSALQNLPEVSLVESLAFYIRQGQAVTVANAPTEGLLRLYGTGRQFLGLGEVLDDGRVRPRRLVRM